jgi:hypothetical protein
MAANYTDIEKALIAGVLAVDAVTPIAYPNDVLESKPDGLWLQLFNLRGSSGVATLGDAGEDNHPGVLQIDINYPENKGSKEVLSKGDEFSDYFKAGSALTYNSQIVRILSCSLGPGRYVGGYYRLSLSISYYARTVRA